MRPLDFTLFLALSLASWQTRGFAQTASQPASSESSHPAATQLLDSAIQALSRPEGVEVHFRQTFRGPSEPAFLTGKSITASKKRVHIDLSVEQKSRKAQVKLLCDGVTFYRLESIPGSNTMVTYSIEELQRVLDQLATNEAERVAKEDVEREQLGVHGFQGISAMVSDLKRRMIFTAPINTTMDLPGKPKHPVTLIEGRWNKETLELIAPIKKTSDTSQQDQRYLWNEKQAYFRAPRAARLYFDQSTKQLLRHELTGILEKQGPETVLTELDILKLNPLATLDIKTFQPSAEELKYKRETIDLASAVKNQHQQTLNMLKQQQTQK